MLKRMLELKKITRNISINCKNATLEKILENEKISFKRYLENDLKCSRKKTCMKLLWGRININSIRNKFDPLICSENIVILLITESKLRLHIPHKLILSKWL